MSSSAGQTFLLRAIRNVVKFKRAELVVNQKGLAAKRQFLSRSQFERLNRAVSTINAKSVAVCVDGSPVRPICWMRFAAAVQKQLGCLANLLQMTEEGRHHSN